MTLPFLGCYVRLNSANYTTIIMIFSLRYHHTILYGN